jgi:glutamate-1-semialdehyde 2,1-aminomutase
MTWMAKWVGGHPVYAASAHGARIEDVDGNAYVDFSLGDTAAMAGHSPPATVAAVQRRFGEQGGAALMLPTEDAAWVGEELARRFGVTQWSFALTATDANRWAARSPGARTCWSSTTATTARSTRPSSPSTARGRGRARATSAPPSTRR